MCNAPVTPAHAAQTLIDRALDEVLLRLATVDGGVLDAHDELLGKAHANLPALFVGWRHLW